MRTLRTLACVVMVVLAGAGMAAGQFGRGAPGMQAPQFRGVLNPVIGAGAVYDMKSDTVSGEVEIALVAREDVDGKPGYWMQMSMTSPQGPMDMKQLVVVDGDKATMTRMIMQMPGMGAMEMPAGMVGAPTSASADVRRDGQLVGTESVTTPAGTFSAQHYKGASGNDWDVWIAANVPPWGLVKSKDSAGEMTLKRVLTGVKDKITGTPQRMDMPPGFPGVPPGAGRGR